MAPRTTVRWSVTALAWALAAFIVFATWAPQGLRPHLASAPVERFGAYFLTAAAFVLAYPRRPVLLSVAAVSFAVVLELGQFLAPGRDPGLPDAIEKALGGVCGVGAAASAGSLRQRTLRLRR
jgi:VanZ family protein